MSPATASRVLTGSARVSRSARLQVEEAVERLGYVRRRPADPDRRTSGAVAAVLCEDSARVFGALHALRRAGRRVPDDVAVIGFDDAPVARQVRPRLTTVRQPAEDLGARLVRELRTYTGGRPISDRGVVLKTKLIVRESA